MVNALATTMGKLLRCKRVVVVLDFMVEPVYGLYSSLFADLCNACAKQLCGNTHFHAFQSNANIEMRFAAIQLAKAIASRNGWH
jgi:hypothetical protein